jgi:hypothetical protein
MHSRGKAIGLALFTGVSLILWAIIAWVVSAFL